MKRKPAYFVDTQDLSQPIFNKGGKLVFESIKDGKVYQYGKRSYPLRVEQIRDIVLLKFGSLTNFDNVINTCGKISRMVNTDWKTVKYVLTKFVSDGYRIIRRVKDRGPKYRTIVSPEVEKLLISEPVLKAWRYLTLA